MIDVVVFIAAIDIVDSITIGIVGDLIVGATDLGCFHSLISLLLERIVFNWITIYIQINLIKLTNKLLRINLA